LLVTTAGLASPTARLVYSRGVRSEICPDESALRQAVAALVGYDAFFPWAARAVVVTVARQDPAFVASVDLIDEQGIRHGGHELRTVGPCSELLDAVALAVAIAIDPRLALAHPGTETGSPPPGPEPTQEPRSADAGPGAPPTSDLGEARLADRPASVSPVESAESAPHGPTPSHRALTFYGSLGFTAAIDVAPEPSLGGAIGAAVRWRSLSIGLEAFTAAPIASPAIGGGTVSSWPLLGAVVPCVHVGALFGCAVLQTGAVFASGDATSDARSTSTGWWAAGGRVGAMFPVSGPLLVRFRADLLGDMSRSILVFNGQDQWTAPVVAGALGVDAVVRFP
jgi:hypothetical protein